MKKFLILLLLSLMTLTSYSQYPKVKIIDGQEVVIVTKKQADDINSRFLVLGKLIDSQRVELSKPSRIDTVVVVKQDTTTASYYKTKLNECYEINRGLSKWFEETNRTAMFFDTCTYKEYKKRYKELQRVRKSRYD